MAKAGRKSVYETHISPHLDEIREAVKNGATIKEIADALGIAESTLNKYKAEKKRINGRFYTRAREYHYSDPRRVA